MWTYEQRTGKLSHDGVPIATGYSGLNAGPGAQGENNPQLQDVHEVGPIPQGIWLIQTPPFDSEAHGPVCLRLVPERQTDTFGRSGFLIHGDSFDHPGKASHGCIVMPRPVRLQIAASGDTDLLVVAGIPT